MSSAAPSLPTNLIPRFALFIACVKRTMGEIILRRHEAGPLAMLLENYLSATLRRLTALHARFAAGRLPAAPRARRPAGERAVAERVRPERRPPGIPRGPVLLTVFRAAYDEQLQALLNDPEMRALLAASPQAGRILRPLWRKLSPDPLPEVLRLPPRPRRPKPPRVARRAPAGLGACGPAGRTETPAARLAAAAVSTLTALPPRRGPIVPCT
jgi:hypothetical protein